MTLSETNLLLSRKVVNPEQKMLDSKSPIDKYSNEPKNHLTLLSLLGNFSWESNKCFAFYVSCILWLDLNHKLATERHKGGKFSKRLLFKCSYIIGLVRLLHCGAYTAEQCLGF